MQSSVGSGQFKNGRFPIPTPTANPERNSRESGSGSGFGVEKESVGGLQSAVGKL